MLTPLVVIWLFYCSIFDDRGDSRFKSKKVQGFKMGLVILGLLALYVLLSILVVIGVIKYSKKNGKSALTKGVSIN